MRFHCTREKRREKQEKKVFVGRKENGKGEGSERLSKKQNLGEKR